MKQLNIKHLFVGELTPLSLGDMSISAGLFTSYHIQNDTEFTMTTLTVGEKHFATVNILGLPVFFDLETQTGNLTLIKDIETELVKASEGQDTQMCSVYVFKELESFNNDIDDMSEKINNTEIYDDFFEKAISDYEKAKSEEGKTIRATPEEVEAEFNNEEDVQFEHIEVFDDNEFFEFDVAIPEVEELLDDLIDIDKEIGELKEMAQNMIEEASHISKHGYKMEDDEYYYEENPEEFTDEDFYWETTLEEDEKFGLNDLKIDISDYVSNHEINREKFDSIYNNGDGAMDEKVDNLQEKQFEERLDNMLEYMLSQSSVGHEPVYKYQYTTKGKVENYVDENGKFLIPHVDNQTEFDADNHIITLRVKRTSQETGEVTSSIEESELMGSFTMDQVIEEVKTNSKYLKNTTVELYTMETKGGKVKWIAHPKK